MTNNQVIIQLSHLEQTIYFACQRQGIYLIDADIVTSLVNISRQHAIRLLSSMTYKKALYRLGRGQYVVIPPDVLYDRKSYVIDPHLIIDELMNKKGLGESYYVAYQSAAAFHGAAHQLPFSLFVAIPEQRRPIKLGNTRIQFVKLSPEKIFGFQQMQYHDSAIDVSTEEKTILDCLERFDLCGGISEVVRTISTLAVQINAGKLLEYLVRMNNQALTQRLGLILERLSIMHNLENGLIDGISKLVGEHIYPLDPHGPKEGILETRWRIKENIDFLGDV